MPRPWSSEYAGRLEEREVDSPALAGNPLGDPAVRPIWIYLPPVYDDETKRRFPVVYVLQGYGGSIGRWANRPLFAPTYPEAVDELFVSGAVPPCLVVFVDAWTALGGSQFVDSPGTGRYHTYLCEDVVGFVDANYRTLASPAHRGLQGKSSGGFGAMVNTMLRPDVFGGIASHAGDTYYELCYLDDIAAAYRALRDRYGRSYANFYKDIAKRPPMSRPEDFALHMIYAVAACFSAEPDGSVLLPFDPNDGALVPGVWGRWLDWDPVRMVRAHADALRSLRAIWIDAGRSDDYRLDVGAERFVAELHAIGVDDVAFELFDGTHSAIDHRYPRSLSYLAHRLSAPLAD